MLDAMFGSMSPVFPFESTPTSSKEDPFGISLNTGAENGFGGTQWAVNDYSNSGTQVSAPQTLLPKDSNGSGFSGSFDTNSWNTIPNGSTQTNEQSRSPSGMVPMNNLGLHETQPVGEGPFALLDPTSIAKSPTRLGRATPSEVYHSVNRP